ncbi:TRAP transporter large permease subunit [Acuticoccus sp.]|uniref:TRAP transporter large permease n=1 Tax=Acuticoccus sp. TaxID=1904378 RepID=UPI003B51830D
MLGRLDRALTAALDGVVVALAGLLLVLLNWAVFARFVLNASVSWGEELPAHILAMLTFIGAALLTRTNEHIGFDGVLRMLPSAAQRVVQAFNLTAIAGFAGTMAYYGTIAAASFAGRPLISIDLPMALFRGAMPLGCALDRRHRRRAPRRPRDRHGGAARPPAGDGRVMPFDPGILILVLLVVLVLTGMPIAFVLGVTAMVMIVLDPAVVPQIMGLIPFGGANNYLLVAALLFMIAGEVMNQGRIAERLIAFAGSLVGHIRGGLAHVNILTSLFFSEISGTATSDAAAIGSVMIPQMKKRGYPVAFAAAVTSTSATMAIIVPPSLNLILYAYVADTSIAALFAAGILPGVLVAFLLMATTWILAVRRGYPTEGPFRLRNVVSTGRDALVPITLPILILFGILSGVFTATEAGAVAALWSIVLAAVLYRTLSLRGFVDTLRIAGKRSAMLMFIVATSTLLGWYLTNQRIPQEIAEAILGISDNPWVVLGAINLFFLAAGTIIHGTPAILMLVPIFLPLADELGIDRVHFGLIITINLGIGQQTPPVASVVLITCAIARISLAAIIPSLMWFIAAMLVALVLVNAIPGLSLWLPSLLL